MPFGFGSRLEQLFARRRKVRQPYGPVRPPTRPNGPPPVLTYKDYRRISPYGDPSMLSRGFSPMARKIALDRMKSRRIGRSFTF